MMRMENSILIGSTFPLSLVRRSVLITIESFDRLKDLLKQKKVVSFWGHQTTVSVANRLLRIDVSPSILRPALRLTPDNFPTLDGTVFDECWVLSPDYKEGYRPKIGEEVSVYKIAGWQVLKIRWLEEIPPDLLVSERRV
jgi:hypothetical protein